MSFKSRLCLLEFVLLICALPVSSSAQEAQAPTQSEPAQAAKPAEPATQVPQPDAAIMPNSSEESPQTRIEADTRKLYQLALEFRTEVGKTYKQSLSVDVLKKAGELEKLAKSLKAEMDHEAFAKKR